MNELPIELRVEGRNYDLRPISDDNWALGTMGLIDYCSGIIYVRLGLDRELTLKILIHEAIHAHQQEHNGLMDEEECKRITRFIHDLLSDNPALVKLYLTEDEEEEE